MQPLESSWPASRASTSSSFIFSPDETKLFVQKEGQRIFSKFHHIGLLEAMAKLLEDRNQALLVPLILRRLSVNCFWINEWSAFYTWSSRLYPVTTVLYITYSLPVTCTHSPRTDSLTLRPTEMVINFWLFFSSFLCDLFPYLFWL